jgi:hypothetical protein
VPPAPLLGAAVDCGVDAVRPGLEAAAGLPLQPSHAGPTSANELKSQARMTIDAREAEPTAWPPSLLGTLIRIRPRTQWLSAATRLPV